MPADKTDKAAVKKTKKELAPKAPPVEKPDANEVDETNEKTEAPTATNTLPASKTGKQEPKWYVLNAQAGHEQKVADSLKQRISASGLESVITEILVPIQKKIVVKGGKQTVKEERLFPGYVLLKMVLDQHTWELVTNIDGVTGFVRTDKYPRPLPEDEVKAIMKFMELEQPSFQASFNVGDAVKIGEGAFADFIGSVNEIDETKGRVKVLISIFGRETPVELEFNQVKKL